ncbi:hypothetical protein CRG98_001544 [Punica granatum]|uniref:Uncharacterized protein n=1 Tax=Punica granatum TaxID=22663 RepID=A0A2I0LBM3_PUNGR|nr:hypothetical protein CRG98_001544 [Punica granatum]
MKNITPRTHLTTTLGLRLHQSHPTTAPSSYLRQPCTAANGLQPPPELRRVAAPLPPCGVQSRRFLGAPNQHHNSRLPPSQPTWRWPLEAWENRRRRRKLRGPSLRMVKTSIRRLQKEGDRIFKEQLGHEKRRRGVGQESVGRQERIERWSSVAREKGVVVFLFIYLFIIVFFKRRAYMRGDDNGLK